MEFKVLGPVEAVRDGERLVLGGPKQRVVLALLLVTKGRTVSVDGLIDGVWGDDPPDSARKSIQVYIHNLRGALGDVIRTDGAGYGIDLLDQSDIDAVRFEALHRTGRDLLDADAETAASLLAEALDLWRGPAYADLHGTLALEPEIARLDELRLQVLEDRVDADLRRGAHALVVSELEAATREYPLRERLRGHLMVALYRLGRHGEALRSFEQLRRYLLEEMGLDPSPELRDLERRILDQDPSLAAPDTTPVAMHARAARGYELRGVVATGPNSTTWRAYQTAVGREAQVTRIDAVIADTAAFISTFPVESMPIGLLEHPHLVPLRDFWREPGAGYLVTPWLQGGYLRQDTDPAASRALTIRNLDQIGSALAHAHRMGVAHGDLSASCIAFDVEGNAYVQPFDPHRDLHRLAEVSSATAIDGDIAALADITEGHLAVEAQGLRALDETMRTATGERVAFRNVEDLIRAVRRAIGADVAGLGSQPDRTSLRNPFKGLRAFQEADAADFFGREPLVATLIEAVQTHPLVALVGPSGSGKSSVVKAGLLPHLRALRTPDQPLFIAEMYPGAYPFEELEAAITEVAVTPPTEPFDTRSIDDDSLLRAIKQCLPDDSSRILIVIDQFEELFSMVDEETTRRVFLANLVKAARDDSRRVSFVITMRADFFDRPLEYPEFAGLVDRGLVTVSPPDREGLARAIAGPARSAGLRIEPGFITEITSDLIGEPGGLPLMQYALTELVEHRSGDTLTIDEYRSLGGVAGALGIRAETVFQSLPPAGREAIRQCFLRLIAIDDQVDDVRRRVRRSELSNLDVDTRALDEAIRQFGAYRLLTFDRDPHTRTPTVEVAHEALLRSWGRLRGWIDSERDDLILHRQVASQVLAWSDAGRDRSYLLRGGRLEQIELWADRTDISLTETERRFLEESIAERARDEAAQLAASRRLRRMLTAVSSFAIVAVIAGVLALIQWRDADDQRHQTAAALSASETGRITADAARLADSNRRVAFLLAAEAYNRDPSAASLGALQQVFIANEGFLGYLGVDTAYTDVAWLGDDRVLGLRQGGADLLALDGTSTTIEIEGRAGVVGVDDSQKVVAIGAGSMVTLYDATSFAPLQELRHGAEVLSIAFDGTGGRVATGDRDGWLRVWSAQTGEEIVEPILAHPERRFEEFGLDPDEVSGPRPHQPTTFRIGTTELLFDGTRLFSAGMIVVRQWDFATGSQIGEDLIVTQTDSDGVTVATPPLALGHSNTPGSLVVATERNLFEWTPGSPLVPTASGTQLAIGAVGLATDVDLAASTAVYAQIGSVITVVELGADSPHFVVDSHLAGDATVSISSDERLLAHAADGGIAIWSLRGDGPISRTADARVGWNDGEPVLAGEVTINSAGDIAVGSADSTPSRLLRIEGGGLVELDRTLVEEWDFLWATGENTLLAIPDLAGHDLYVLDRDTLEPRQPPLTTSGFFALHIGPQGYVALANQPPVIDVFDLATNAHVETLDDLEAVAGQAAQVASLGFSPDGTRLVAATRDGVAAVWDTSTWQPVAPFPLSGGSGQVVGAKYAPDGRLVTVADSGVVVVRNADTLQPEGAALISAQDVAGFSHGPFIDPSERYLLTTAQGEPILWSMTERAQIGQPFPNGIGLVASASADARWLVTLWNDRIVLWDLDVDSWVDVACRLAGRNLTLDEWNQFGPNDVPYHATCDRWPADDDTGR